MQNLQVYGLGSRVTTNANHAPSQKVLNAATTIEFVKSMGSSSLKISVFHVPIINIWSFTLPLRFLKSVETSSDQEILTLFFVAKDKRVPKMWLRYFTLFQLSLERLFTNANKRIALTVISGLIFVYYAKKMAMLFGTKDCAPCNKSCISEEKCF